MLSGLDPTIHHTLGEHTNYYTIDAVQHFWVIYSNQYYLYKNITLEGVIGPAQALTAISGSLGDQEPAATFKGTFELSGDHGWPIMGCVVLSSALSNGT